MRAGSALACVLAMFVSITPPAMAEKIPYFARRYGVPCRHCHVAPPMLNAFGEGFFARGYDQPGLTPRRSWPFAVWVSARSEFLPVPSAVADDVRGYLNRVEIISGGKLVAPWLSYFVEWRPVSEEARSNGTLRDRSGRFEDLFVTAASRHAELTVGQFRQLAQVDVSRRLGLSEPTVLSSSLADLRAGGTPRERSLRGFAPAGRSPSVRAAWNQPAARGWRWTASLALPVPGELSIPLSDSAEVEASHEIEWRLKGVFAESFVRRGLTSFGAHVFYDDGDRYLVNAITTGSRAALHWTAMAGLTRSAAAAGARAVTRGQWSVEAQYLPSHFFGVGGRVEDRAGDRQDAAFLPYVNAHFPGTRYTARLTLERRMQQDRRPRTFLELGFVF